MIHRCGNWYIRNGEPYILAQVGVRTYCLIRLTDGNRFHDPKKSVREEELPNAKDISQETFNRVSADRSPEFSLYNSIEHSSSE